MKRIASMAVLSALVILLGSCRTGGGLGEAPGCATVPDPTCHSITVKQSDGSLSARNYVLHIPANFPATSGALVVALHGSGESGLEFEQHTQLDTTSEVDGFAVAYPDGSPTPRDGNLREWNWYFNGNPSTTDVLPDDVAFIRQLITSLQATLQVNPKKIYVTGVSAGGLMAVRAGVEISDLVAAIAPLSGALTAQEVGLGESPSVVPAALGPVSVIMLHADKDHNVPYCGDNFNASQDPTFNYWVAADAATTLDTTTAGTFCKACVGTGHKRRE